jgi:hypothetical protein
MMKRTQRALSGLSILAIAIAAAATAQAASPGPAINLAPLKPTSPGFGQTVQITVLVSNNSKPVPHAQVEFWFSGRHGVQSYHWAGYTDKTGYCTILATVPRDWAYGIQGDKTWVDLNVACNQLHTANMWRIKNK